MDINESRAGQLPEPAGLALLEAARAVFTSGFNTAGGVSAGPALLTVLSASLLRRVRPTAERSASSGSAPPHLDQEAAVPTGRPSSESPPGPPSR